MNKPIVFFGDLVYNFCIAQKEKIIFMDNLTIDCYISLDEAAQYLGIKPVTLREWIKKLDTNKIPAHKIGKQWKFKKGELDSWIKSGMSAI